MNHRHNQAFTIVELLIVIVVIGILAAIVIVAYQGVTSRANDAAVQSDLRGLASKIAQFQAVSPTSAVPTATEDELAPILRVNKKSYYVGAAGTVTYCRNDTDFAVFGRSASKQAFVYSSKTGLKKVAYLGDVNNQCLAGGIDVGTDGGGSGPGDAGAGQIRLLRGQGDVNPGWLSWVQ